MARKSKAQPVAPLPAGFISRLAAWFTDQLVIVVAFVVIGVSVDLIATFVGKDLSSMSGATMVALFGTASFAAAVSAVYMGVFWYLFGSTLGQLLFGLRVVRSDGRWQLGLGQVVVRIIGFYLSTAVFFLGFLWILVDPNRRGWHDIMARTRVVYTFDASSVAATPGLLRMASGMRHSGPGEKKG